MQSDFQNWADFQSILVRDILPIYQISEQRFDAQGLHGRKHIIRSLIFGEIMANFYQEKLQVSLDRTWIRVAISFHDSARKANGPDFWEKESSKLCFDYLIGFGFPVGYCEKISDSILNFNPYKKSLETQIIHDADVIEILRLFIGNPFGLSEFRQEEFRFLSSGEIKHFMSPGEISTVRKTFLEEAWTFINSTETDFLDFDNVLLLDQILQILTGNSKKLRFLNKWKFY